MNGTKEGQLPSERALAKFLVDNGANLPPLNVDSRISLSEQIGRAHV